MDVHAHYFGGAVGQAINAGPPATGGFRLGSWTVGSALEFMDRHGIAAQVLSLPLEVSGRLPADAAATFARTVNVELAEQVRERPDRFGAFATLPLTTPDAALAELEHALDVLDCDGVTLPSNSQGHYFGQPLFEPILAELGRRGVPTFVHPAEPPGIAALGFGRPSSVIEFPFDTARTVVNAIYSGVFRRHPGLRLILAHAGGGLPTLAWRIGEHLQVGRGPDDDAEVTRDHITQVLAALYYDTAMSPGPHSLQPLLACTGADHVLFGTDWPAAPEYAVTDADDEFARWDGLSATEKAGVGRGNAERLFPRLAATAGAGAR